MSAPIERDLQHCATEKMLIHTHWTLDHEHKSAYCRRAAMRSSLSGVFYASRLPPDPTVVVDHSFVVLRHHM